MSGLSSPDCQGDGEFPLNLTSAAPQHENGILERRLKERDEEIMLMKHTIEAARVKNLQAAVNKEASLLTQKSAAIQEKLMLSHQSVAEAYDEILGFKKQAKHAKKMSDAAQAEISLLKQILEEMKKQLAYEFQSSVCLRLLFRQRRI